MSTATATPTQTTVEPPRAFPLSRALAVPGILGPTLLLASSVAWIFGADQLRFVLQFFAAPLLGLGLVAVCAVFALRAPRAAGVLAVIAAAGFAFGGVGFAIDGLHETLFDSPSLAHEGGLAGAIAPTLAGMTGQLAMAGIGIALLRTKVAPPLAGAALIAAALLFPVSRIGGIPTLAIVVDLLIALAVVPLAWRMWQGRPLRDA